MILLIIIVIFEQWLQGDSYNETHDIQKNGFDLGLFVGDLAFEDDASRYFLLLILNISIWKMSWGTIYLFFPLE